MFYKYVGFYRLFILYEIIFCLIRQSPRNGSHRYIEETLTCLILLSSKRLLIPHFESCVVVRSLTSILVVYLMWR